MKLPLAKTENIIEQILKNETLIFDLDANKAFNLNETSTIVYRNCDGATTFDELKHRHKFTDEFIHLALVELKRNNLLADNSYKSPFTELKRREVIKKVGLASMLALPVIVGLTAPQSAHAASVCAPGSPNGFGERNGQQVGTPVFRNNPQPETCADYPVSDRDSFCNAIFASQCCSNRAVSDNCRQLDPNRTTYDCVCSA